MGREASSNVEIPDVNDNDERFEFAAVSFIAIVIINQKYVESLQGNKVLGKNHILVMAFNIHSLSHSTDDPTDEQTTNDKLHNSIMMLRVFVFCSTLPWHQHLQLYVHINFEYKQIHTTGKVFYSCHFRLTVWKLWRESGTCNIESTILHRRTITANGCVQRASSDCATEDASKGMGMKSSWIRNVCFDGLSRICISLRTSTANHFLISRDVTHWHSVSIHHSLWCVAISTIYR